MVISDAEHRKNKRGFVIYSILFIGILSVGIYVKQERKDEKIRLDEFGETTTGIVTSVRRTVKGDWVRYVYTCKNVKYKDVKKTRNKDIQVGNIYVVEYLPFKPEVNRIDFKQKIQFK